MEILIRNLSKKFKDNLVLDNVNLKFESGNIYGFVGENGSGKSVLLKLICSFYIPSNGEILIDNINYCDNSSFPNNLRAFIDIPSFYPEKTGFENLKILAKIQNKINATLKETYKDFKKNKKNFHSFRKFGGLAYKLMQVFNY